MVYGCRAACRTYDADTVVWAAECCLVIFRRPCHNGRGEAAAKLDTMRSRYATATPALIPEYERIAGAEPSRLLTFHAPEIVFGIDSMAEAAHAVVRLGALRPLLVTDPRLIEAGWVDEMLGHLRAQCVDARLWSGLTPNPKDHEIAAGYALGTRTRGRPRRGGRGVVGAGGRGGGAGDAPRCCAAGSETVRGLRLRGFVVVRQALRRASRHRPCWC